MNRTKKILMSLALVGAVAAAVGLGSVAFFTDTETSKDNVLQAGAIDLKIDNESYYYDGVVRKMENMSWDLVDLTIEKFFDLGDLKPGDWGEDTISLHVTSNPAWVCANVKLTSSDENVLLENEGEAGDITDGKWGGELGDELNFVFWLDDGDNVYECGESPNGITAGDATNGAGECEEIILTGKPSDLPQGVDNAGETFALADSSTGEPAQPNTDYYIGKFWCYGELSRDPVKQDGFGDQIDPVIAGPGFTCNGAAVTNVSQTDKLTADIAFEAVQARHNNEFVCNPVEIEVTQGDLIPSLALQSGAMRIKAQAGEGIYLGEQDLGVGSNRVQTAIAFPGGTGTYPFTLSYNSTTKELNLTGVNPSPVNLVWDTDNPPATCTNWNVLRLTARDSRGDAGVALENVVLGGNSLGNFGTFDVPGSPGYQHWSVTGFDFLSDWTLTADLKTQNFVGNEALKVEVTLGCQP